jgi:hypothetical protein
VARLWQRRFIVNRLKLGQTTHQTSGRCSVKTYRILAVTLIALLLIGCSGAKYAEEKTLLTAVTKAMETLTASVNEAGDPSALTSAISAFSGQIEKLVPQMKQLSTDHPDWETNPPSELKDTLDKFNSASAGMKGIMPKVMQMAGQHADNAQLQDALKKFQSVVAGL